MKNRVDIAEQRVPPENWSLEESRTSSGCDDELLAIYESTPFMILLLDQERRICKANRVARGFSGPDSRDVTGRRSGEALRCIHSIDDPRGCGFGHHCDNCTMRRIIAETMATGKSHHHVEVHFPFNAGETIKNLAFLISTTRLVVRNEPHILVIIQDITAIKETEADHLRLLTAIDQAAEAIVLADGRRRILYVNQAFERITGCSRTQTLGQDWAQWHGTPHEPSIHDIIFEQLKTGTAWQGRITNSRPDGTTYEAEMTVSPIRDAAGNATDFVSVIRDVTRESQLESQLLHAQKMEAIGTLAGGIAHDFNNILQALLGYATLVETSVAANSEIAAYVREIKTSGHRASELVKQILSFSRHSERDRQNVLLQTVINEVLKLLQSTLPATIEIMRTISEDCPPIWADSTQIHQVLMNLCTNAYHALRGAGGIIEIGLKKILVSSGQLLDLPAGAYAQLTVRDNGVGMDGATRDRIFDPYFTTKKPGEGTGLGLATVLGIVKSHGGAISVQSRVGMGSTFNVYFPVSQCAAPGVNARTASQTCIGGCERILLVDDEVPITKAGKRILERLGYSVTGCNNSLEALEIFRSSPAAFDIVITDQTMPRLTGVELARALLEIRPDIPVVLCTGYSECVDEHTASTAGIRQFLMKPVSRETLTHTIRKLFVENQ